MTLNSACGHLYRMRRLLLAASLPDAEREAILHHVTGAEAALASLSGPSPAALTPKRDPANFEPNGRYLSTQGRAVAARLFQNGHSIRAVAEALGISPSAAGDHRRAWLSSQNIPAD